jgi:hypothetical protein
MKKPRFPGALFIDYKSMSVHIFYELYRVLVTWSIARVLSVFFGVIAFFPDT